MSCWLCSWSSLKVKKKKHNNNIFCAATTISMLLFSFVSKLKFFLCLFEHVNTMDQCHKCTTAFMVLTSLQCLSQENDVTLHFIILLSIFQRNTVGSSKVLNVIFLHSTVPYENNLAKTWHLLRQVIHLSKHAQFCFYQNDVVVQIVESTRKLCWCPICSGVTLWDPGHQNQCETVVITEPHFYIENIEFILNEWY